MTSVGIDAISLYTPPYALALTELAQARDVDPLKYAMGLGQEVMSVMPPREDIVTMAAAAALPLIEKEPSLRNEISMVIFATESSVDQSKAASTWVHHLLELQSRARVIELKQACYSATFALQMACAFARQKPETAVLVIASDSARYGIQTPGEPTQGCGAVAFIVRHNPRIFRIEEGSGLHTEHVMDFWRPSYLETALVDGKYSTRIYLTALQSCWKHYQEATQRSFEQHARFCYHVPFCKMAEKAHEKLVLGHQFPIESSAVQSPEDAGRCSMSQHALYYPKQIGNSYSASLYISLASLLENDPEDLSEKRIGLFSYGSGCMAEFFSGIVVQGYKAHLAQERHMRLIQARIALNCKGYEHYFMLHATQQEHLQQTGTYIPPESASGPFVFVGAEGHIRKYKRVD